MGIENSKPKRKSTDEHISKKKRPSFVFKSHEKKAIDNDFDISREEYRKLIEMIFERSLLEANLVFDRNDSKTCRVCGDNARIKFYGVLSCQSCKTFFRRYNLHPEIVRSCQYNDDCEVNMLTRHTCAACRLAKCFSIGMNANLIRKDKRKASIQANYQIVPLDLLTNDRSLLTTAQWTLVSNVIHAFDRYGIMSEMKHLAQNVSSANLQTPFTVDNALKLIGSAYLSIQSLINCTPEFQVLCTDEQKSLLQRNLHGIGCYYSNLLYRDSEIFDNSACCLSFRLAYGLSAIEKSKVLVKCLDIDSTLFQLLLIIIAFSSNCFIVDFDSPNNLHDSFLFGTFRLFGSQNIYVELLWKYMMYRYGYNATIIRFSKLIGHVINMLRYIAEVYLTHSVHRTFVDGVVEETKDILVDSQNQPVALWGKTVGTS
ncbi:unnamed protein product [Adineta ricciae]|uniref:Nuclear receptor domain-containing protein n=1 Tax=Adineta ricciae TaxID=249248 RepID=A0A814NEN7_ADIRI|nr:unnamed protein product [Adineta ricciae]